MQHDRLSAGLHATFTLLCEFTEGITVGGGPFGEPAPNTFFCGED